MFKRSTVSPSLYTETCKHMCAALCVNLSVSAFLCTLECTLGCMRTHTCIHACVHACLYTRTIAYMPCADTNLLLGISCSSICVRMHASLCTYTDTCVGLCPCTWGYICNCCLGNVTHECMHTHRHVRAQKKKCMSPKMLVDFTIFFSCSRTPVCACACSLLRVRERIRVRVRVSVRVEPELDGE